MISFEPSTKCSGPGETRILRILSKQTQRPDSHQAAFPKIWPLTPYSSSLHKLNRISTGTAGLLHRVSKQTWTDVPRATSCLSVRVFSGIPSTGGQKFPPSPSPWEAVGEGTLPKPPITRTTTKGSAEQIWNTTNLNSTDQESPGAGNEPQFP